MARRNLQCTIEERFELRDGRALACCLCDQSPYNAGEGENRGRKAHCGESSSRWDLRMLFDARPASFIRPRCCRRLTYGMSSGSWRIRPVCRCNALQTLNRLNISDRNRSHRMLQLLFPSHPSKGMIRKADVDVVNIPGADRVSRRDVAFQTPRALSTDAMHIDDVPAYSRPTGKTRAAGRH